jgi:hypothetical protein
MARRERGLTEQRGSVRAFLSGNMAEHESEPEQASKQSKHDPSLSRHSAQTSSDISIFNQDHRSNAGLGHKALLIFRQEFGNQA